MTLIIETGAGVRNANSYGTVAFITQYLTDRGKEADWVALTPAQQEAAAIAATDYIDKVNGAHFRGDREFVFDEVTATAAVEFTGVPAAGGTVLLGDQTYTFVTALSSPSVANEVVLGGDASACASNLADAITATAEGLGVTYSEGTAQNRAATVDLDALADTPTIVKLHANGHGDSGNETVLTVTATNTTTTAFAGGDDGGSQPLEFPRRYLYDRRGVLVQGIPLKLKQAFAEYADRARADSLMPDPEIDPTGQQLSKIRQKADVVEEEKEFGGDSRAAKIFVVRPYPEADKLLAEYKLPVGKAIR